MPSKADGFSPRTYLMAITFGAAFGLITRLLIFGDASNEVIMSSLVGLAVFWFIGRSIFRALMFIQYKIWFFLAWPLFCVTAGIMWVIPLPA